MKRNIIIALEKVKKELINIKNPEWYGYVKIYHDGVVGIIGSAGAENEIVIKIGDCKTENNYLYASPNINRNTNEISIYEIASFIILEITKEQISK